MHSRALWLLVPAVLGSCADSCSCAKKPEAAAASAGARASAAPSVAPNKPALVAQAGAPAAPPTASGGPAWEEAPPSPLTEKLEASKKAIETDRVFGALVASAAFEKALHDKIGKLKAEAPATLTARGDGKIKLSTVVRDYAGAGKNVRIKVTDTGLLPNARHSISNRLTLIGNAVTGHERGVFVRNAPAVVGHFDADQVSRASALLAQRFLVEVTVRGTRDPDEALHVLEQIDLSALARDSK